MKTNNDFKDPSKDSIDYATAVAAQEKLLSKDEKFYANNLDNCFFDDAVDFMDENDFVDLTPFIYSKFDIEVIMSIRNLGKTFGVLFEYLENYMNSGERFALMVENNSVLPAMRTRLNKVIRKKDMKLTIRAVLATPAIMIYYDMEDDKKIAGYAISIGAARQNKNVDFENVTRILVDEFNTYKIDMYDFFTLLGTIKRDDETKVILLGNNVNPMCSFSEIFDLTKSNVNEERNARISLLEVSPVYIKEAGTIAAAKGTLYEQQNTFNNLDFVDFHGYIFEYSLQNLFKTFYEDDYKKLIELQDEAEKLHKIYLDTKRNEDKLKAHYKYLESYKFEDKIKDKVRNTNILEQLVNKTASTYIMKIFDDGNILHIIKINPYAIYDILKIQPNVLLDGIINNIPKIVCFSSKINGSDIFNKIFEMGTKRPNIRYYILLQSQKYFRTKEFKNNMHSALMMGTSPIQKFASTLQYNTNISYDNETTKQLAERR